LLERVFRTLVMVEVVSEVVVAVPRNAQAFARAQAEQAQLPIPVKITEGGAQRQDSVRLALMLTSAEADLVVVHDAARPLASSAMFSACLSVAVQSGGALVAIPVADTLKQVENGNIIATVARDGLWQAQTPQAFRRELLVEAHEWALREQISVTDDAQLFERRGLSVHLIAGSPLNLKITTPDDLAIANALVRSVSPG
jgi:2-C-methyl-D-erythritol 4-phosphate cytidylyltransferase